MDSGNNRIQKFAPGSAIGETIVSTTFNTPRGFHLDSIGNIYIADQNNNRVLLFRCGKWQISLSLPLLRLFINFCFFYQSTMYRPQQLYQQLQRHKDDVSTTHQYINIK